MRLASSAGPQPAPEVPPSAFGIVKWLPTTGFALWSEAALFRVFPYTSLSDLSFLEASAPCAPTATGHGGARSPVLCVVQVRGYIAGVLNPMFLEREDWWEVPHRTPSHPALMPARLGLGQC